MYTKRKKSYITNFIFSIILLGTPLYGDLIHQNQEKVLKKRVEEKGEFLLPCTPLACITAILISYLASSEDENHYITRFATVESCKRSYFFRNKYKSLPSLEWSDIVEYCTKNQSSKKFFNFIIEQEDIFKNFCHNMYFWERSTYKYLQNIANALNINIEVYEPSFNNPINISKVKKYLAVPRTNDFPPIRIVQDKYKGDLEVQYGDIHNNHHYRPLVYKSPKYNSYQENISNFEINNTANKENILIGLSNHIYPKNPVITKMVDKDESKKLQINRFKAITCKLEEIVEKKEKDIFQNMREGDIDKLEKNVSFYIRAENSKLIKELNKFRSVPLPSMEKVKKKMKNSFDTIRNSFLQIDFYSDTYHQKTIQGKTRYLIDLKKKIQMLLYAKTNNYTNENISQFIKKVLTERVEDINTNLSKILKNSSLEVQHCERINSYLETLDLFDQLLNFSNFKKTKKEAAQYKENTTLLLGERILMIREKSIKHINQLESVVESLIQLFTFKKFINKTFIKATGVNKEIKCILDKFQQAHQSNSIIKLNKLANSLQKKPLGSELVAENSTFRSISIMLRNRTFDSISFENIIENIQEYQAKNNKEGIVKSTIAMHYLEEIKDAYKQFDKLYWKLVKKHLGSKNASEVIVATIKKKYMCPNQVPGNIQWDNSIRQKITGILAHIFALWTLKNTDHYKRKSKNDSNNITRDYLLHPHPAQIVAIMRILGVDQGVLKSHLVEIGTGEGKSVVAFATATTLALLGFDVNCVCYSPYLSLRDQANFMPLVQEIGMDKHIIYTTFNKLCESTINKQGDVRERLIDFIKQSSNLNKQDNDNVDDEKKDDNVDHVAFQNESSTQVSNSSNERAQVIFIDEVDVFFDKNFYGKPYAPAALLQHPTITKIIEFVWDNRKNITYEKVRKQCGAYRKCRNIFSKWGSLIEQAVRNMVNDVQNYSLPEYVIHNAQLCYKDGDSISPTISYKYKTTFACLSENEQITKENMEAHLGIYLNFGLFSYAEIPHQFDCILGVTGTLASLPLVAVRILERGYQIKQHTYMPSLYGASKRKFFKHSSKGVRLEKKKHYYGVLKNEITEQLRGNVDDLPDKRAVIVFFENARKITAFQTLLTDFTKDLQKINIMTSDLSYEEKNRRISKATNPGMITLAVREFGRGTDFINYDLSVNKYGGVHVIITFFPESTSEEFQLVGRTARQGNQGSISMVLEEEALEGLISSQEIENIRGKSDDFYTLLNKRRNELFSRSYADSIEHVNSLKEKHQKTAKFFERLFLNQINDTEVTAYLALYNIPPAPTMTKTIILVDATCSMGPALKMTQQKVSTMFERIHKVLKNKPGSCSIQFVAYRNYNAPPRMILEVSPWVNEPNELVQFMNNIYPCYGWGNEAIEVALWHANREHNKREIHQVILIGDSAPNTKDEIMQKRGDSYFSQGHNWKRDPVYSKSTYYKDELKKLKKEGIPVHAFYIPSFGNQMMINNTKNAFDEIASETGGQSAKLDIHSDGGAEQLTNVVSMRVVERAGGEKALKEYKKLYCEKSHIK